MPRHRKPGRVAGMQTSTSSCRLQPPGQHLKSCFCVYHALISFAYTLRGHSQFFSVRPLTSSSMHTKAHMQASGSSLPAGIYFGRMGHVLRHAEWSVREHFMSHL